MEAVEAHERNQELPCNRLNLISSRLSTVLEVTTHLPTVRKTSTAARCCSLLRPGWVQLHWEFRRQDTWRGVRTGWPTLRRSVLKVHSHFSGRCDCLGFGASSLCGWMFGLCTLSLNQTEVHVCSYVRNKLRSFVTHHSPHANMSPVLRLPTQAVTSWGCPNTSNHSTKKTPTEKEIPQETPCRPIKSEGSIDRLLDTLRSLTCRTKEQTTMTHA